MRGGIYDAGGGVSTVMWGVYWPADARAWPLRRAERTGQVRQRWVADCESTLARGIDIDNQEVLPKQKSRDSVRGFPVSFARGRPPNRRLPFRGASGLR